MSELRKYLSKSILESQIKLRGLLSISILVEIYMRASINLYSDGKNGTDGWRQGDWLINYSAGFIRRGVIGQMLLGLHLNPKSTLLTLYVLQISLYLPLLIIFMWFLIKNKFSWGSIILTLNPAGLLFPGLGIGGFGRKEIFGIVILVSLSYLHFRKIQNEKALLTSLLFFYLVSILISEVNYLFFPTILYFLFKSNLHQKFLKVISVGLSFLYLSEILFLYHFSGNVKQSLKICNHLVFLKYNKHICDGAITFLPKSSHEVFLLLKNEYPRNFLYLIVLVLGLCPIFTSTWFTKDKLNKFYVASILLFSIPLFFSALDYGRWIFMIVIQITIFIIATSEANSIRFPLAMYKFSIPYTFLWGFPNYLISSSVILRDSVIGYNFRLFSGIVNLIMKLL